MHQSYIFVMQFQYVVCYLSMMPRFHKVFAGVGVLPILLFTNFAKAESVIYNSLPDPLPPNVVSQGYQCCGIGQFGNLVNFSGTDRSLTGATLVLSDFALRSTPANQNYGTDAGYNQLLTLNLYNVNADNSVGSLIGSQSITAFVPYRPEADPTCPGGTAYRASNGNCYNGKAFLVSFALNQSVPDSIIYGLSFNTQSYGPNPTGVDGPYNSLNFGLITGPPSVGSSAPGVAYTDSKTFPPSGGPGVFSRDATYAPYTPAIEFTAVPEPGSIFLMGIGLAFLLYNARKRIIA